MTDPEQTGIDRRDEMNIGELADDQLGHLTSIEELVDDLANGREVYQYQIEEAVEHVAKTQKNANVILRRFEEQVGPIGRYPRTDGGQPPLDLTDHDPDWPESLFEEVDRDV